MVREGRMTVAIRRAELSAADLRREAKRCQDAAAVRPMLALAPRPARPAALRDG